MVQTPVHTFSSHAPIVEPEPETLDAETLQAMLDARIYELACSDRERETVTEAYQHEHAAREKAEAEANRLKIEKEDLQVQLTRAMEKLASVRTERDELQRWRNSVHAICALPHEQKGPYDKLGWIVGHDERPYPASVHGGSDQDMLTSMGKWAEHMGCSLNTVTKVAEKLEAAGSITREKVNLNDGRTHYSVAWNEEHWIRPVLSLPAEPRSHNGGNKRCPQCGGYCKKKMTIRYECEKCGIDFDAEMNPIGHEPPALSLVETPTPEPEPEKSIQPVLTLPMVKRPLNCHCGMRSHWYQDGALSHCERCEPFHVRSAS